MQRSAHSGLQMNRSRSARPLIVSFGGPPVARDSVNRRHDAGAVRAATAMNEDRPIGGIVDRVQESFDFVIARCEERTHREVDRAKSKRPRLAFFVAGAIACAAQVDDRFGFHMVIFEKSGRDGAQT